MEVRLGRRPRPSKPLFKTGDVHDGERICAPWGRLTQIGTGQPKFEKLSETLKEIGIQGVRPVSAAEIPEISLAEERLKSVLLEGVVTSPAPKEIHAAYCYWKKHNGVIADEIKKRHTKFFDWLNCR